LNPFVHFSPREFHFGSSEGQGRSKRGKAKRLAYLVQGEAERGRCCWSLNLSAFDWPPSLRLGLQIRGLIFRGAGIISGEESAALPGLLRHRPTINRKLGAVSGSELVLAPSLSHATVLACLIHHLMHALDQYDSRARF
jgi:hypothetical protein